MVSNLSACSQQVFYTAYVWPGSSKSANGLATFIEGWITRRAFQNSVMVRLVPTSFACF